MSNGGVFFIMLIQCHSPLVFEVSDKTLCRAVFVCTTPAKKSKSALKASSPVETHKKFVLRDHEQGFTAQSEIWQMAACVFLQCGNNTY